MTSFASCQQGAGTSRDGGRIAGALKSAKAPVIILSADVLSLSSAEPILAAIERIVHLAHARLVTVHPYGNMAGLLSLVPMEAAETVSRLVTGGRINTLCLVEITLSP